MNLSEAISIRPNRGFRIIYADPPWQFKNWSEDGEDRNANQHYDCMSIEDIYDMKIEAIASENSLLFLWVTDPLLQEGIETMRRWGFEYKTVGFVWHKTRESGAEFMGCGYYTRANPEMCLIGRRGKPGYPKDRSIRQYQAYNIREHSRKPDEIRDLITKMYDGPRIELFARQKSEGWESWGNQTEKFTGG